jgi:hypothetical protein
MLGSKPVAGSIPDFGISSEAPTGLRVLRKSLGKAKGKWRSSAERVFAQTFAKSLFQFDSGVPPLGTITPAEPQKSAIFK